MGSHKPSFRMAEFYTRYRDVIEKISNRDADEGTEDLLSSIADDVSAFLPSTCLFLIAAASSERENPGSMTDTVGMLKRGIKGMAKVYSDADPRFIEVFCIRKAAADLRAAQNGACEFADVSNLLFSEVCLFVRENRGSPLLDGISSHGSFAERLHGCNEVLCEAACAILAENTDGICAISENERGALIELSKTIRDKIPSPE